VSLVPDPVDFLGMSANDVYSIEPVEVERYRLEAARERFAKLRDEVPLLDRLATFQKLDRVETIDDVVPLVFQHTVFKSYPLAVLERSRFDLLTEWVDKLTSHDLSSVDVSNCDTITGWILELERQSPMRLEHTSGTGGVISIMPRSTSEAERMLSCWYFMHDGVGQQPSYDLKTMPIVFFGYKNGLGKIQRKLRTHFALTPGTEDRTLCLYESPWDADLLSAAGRLKSADEQGKPVDDVLESRRADLLEGEQLRRQDVTRFLDRVEAEVAGQVCAGQGAWSDFLAASLAAEARGMSAVFDPSSPINPGGGFKGGFKTVDSIPDDWYERICAFLGFRELFFTYGMTEIIPDIRSCPQHRIHMPPFIVPFVVDPDDSTPRPRQGIQTGRFLFLDLLAESYWGAFATGDEVTIHWDEQCPCGRRGAFLEDRVERYVFKRGNDKIPCARVPDAHERAVEFLNEGL
jgi:hypothetical protein